MHPLRPLVALAALAFAAPGLHAASAPDWVRAASATPERSLPRGTAAHILADEHFVEIAPNGTIKRRERHVIRILTGDGRKHAFASTGYDRSADKLVSLRAWLVSPAGKVTEFKLNDIVHAAVYSSWFELYGDAWQAFIFGSDSATPGSVFAYEAVKHERSVFSQDFHQFQSGIPCERSAFSVKVSPGWRVNGRVFNAESVEPLTAGGWLTWTMRGLPALPDEAMSPSTGASTPWLAVDYLRPEGAKGSSRSWAYATWREVSEQFTPMHDSASEPDPVVRSRAEAVVGSAASRLEEIRALCTFVQGLNYVSIVMNSAAGGGMIPRQAARVLACGYGDCKDKTALLRSLLSARGFGSHAVVLYAGDSERVQESWPSPLQFNHCIVAIRVDDSVAGPAVIEHGTLGRLLLFDPTSRDTPAGFLPWNDQGSLALVLAGASGALVRIPSANPEDGTIVRRIRARLHRGGGVEGTISEKFMGNASVVRRKEHRDRTPAQYHEMVEKWLGITMPAARALKTAPADDFAAAQFSLEIDFQAPVHGRSMHDRLLVFKPVLVARRGAGLLAPGERRTPVVFEAFSLSEVVEIDLPAEFRIEDMVEPVDIEAPFGSYRAAGRLEGEGRLVFERTFVLKRSVIPPSDYGIVRDFFEKVIDAEKSPVVLTRLPVP